MKHFLYLYLCFLLFTVGCTQQKTMTSLTHIDSLLENNSFEAAGILLQSLDVSEMSEEEVAFFYLLKTIYYKEIGDGSITDSLVNKSIAYYEHSTDKAKLIRAYCTRSYFLYDTQKASEAVLQLKKAEELAEKIRDKRLLVQVYSCLASYNLFSGQTKMAMSYARKVKAYAVQIKDNRWIGFANLSLFTIFYGMDEKDSIDFYIRESLPYAEHQSLRVRPLFYNNIAVYYIEKKEYEKAKHYLDLSLSVSPLAHSYYLLAKIYSEEGKNEVADSFWKKALQEKDARRRLDIIQEYGNWLTQQKRYKEASEESMRFIALKDSFSHISETENIVETQHFYDRQRTEKVLSRYIGWGGLLSLMALTIGLLLSKRHRNKLNRMRSEAADIHARIVIYQQELQKLKEDNYKYQQALVSKQEEIISNDEKIALLEQKIKDLQDRQLEMFSKGKHLYDNIMSGETLILWKKHDMKNFIEFYQLLNYDFYQQLESQSYSLLQKVYLILSDMGKREEEIKQIMNLSDGAFRTMRYRIRRKGDDE